MKINWFRRNGIFFIPTSIIGWIILLSALAFSVYTFIDIDSRSHSASDTLDNFAFHLLFIGAAYSLVAYLTSRSPKT
jgi:putative effector of murein hydrolase LrgA (UPF0299 family)